MKKAKAVHRPKFTNTRKALRKQKRQTKKVHRQEHYLKKKNKVEEENYTPGRFVKRPAETPDPAKEVKKKKPKLQTSAQDILLKERQKEQKEVSRLNNAMEEQRRKIMLQANEDEDKIIKKLEKQLGLNKSKNKNNYFADDGLDYLLEICDRATSEQIVAAERHLADVDGDSDFEEDLATVTGKDVKDNAKTTGKVNKDKDMVTKKGAQRDENVKSKNLSKNNTSEDDRSELDDDEGSDVDSGDESVMSDDEMTGEDDTDSEDIEDDIVDDGSDSDSDAPEEKPTKSKKAESKLSRKEVPEKSEKLNQKQPESKTSKNERLIKEDDLSKVFSDDEISHLSGDDDMFTDDEIGEGENSDGESNEVKKDEKPDVWEDIYGRKRDKEGNVIKEEKGVYIPPHLRNKDSTSEKDLAQLRRQVKSILNKLAGTNLHWACTSIENLYASNSRHAVNSVLTQQWLEACVSVDCTPDRLLAEHAALVCGLHANVATEIGAHFLEQLSKLLDSMLQAPPPMADKRLDNVVACLAHLYNFKIYHATLLYDIMHRLLEDLTEKNIECILVALRTVGGVLRKEEPAALKEFIHKTQATVAKLNESATAGSRIKFLLEVLMAVKNNNLTKIPNYDPSYSEQLKKATRAIVRKGNYVTPLNVTLEDLLKAEERGKWWIVGSAWEGARELPATTPAAPVPGDQKLLELARKQRMNTDVRRNVFCVIMAAEDYMDAFEKLQHLGLKGHQEREIVHVLLACCLNETEFNPYYAVLAQKLCDTHRKYQLSLQFSVWDRIKELEGLPRHSAANLARLLAHLIIETGLPLSVLKIIQFSDLTKRSLRFMRQILLAIIMNSNLEASIQVFHRISKAAKLHTFRESLRLFILHFLIKNAGKTDVLTEKEMDLLKERALEVDKILTMHESKLQL